MNNDKPHLILFDCDGVLYPTTQLPTWYFIDAFKKTLNFLKIDQKTLLKADTRRSKQEYPGIYNKILFICREMDIPFEAVVNIFLSYVDYSALKENKFLNRYLLSLHKQIPCCIVTNNHKKHLKHVFNRVLGTEPTSYPIPQIDISDRFDGQGFLSKNNPNCFLKICRHFQIDPQKTVCVDDTASIIDTAKQIGMDTVLVSQHQPLPQQVNQCLSRFRQRE